MLFTGLCWIEILVYQHNAEPQLLRKPEASRLEDCRIFVTYQNESAEWRLNGDESKNPSLKISSLILGSAADACAVSNKICSLKLASMCG
jgi:hypothetical protein